MGSPKKSNEHILTRGMIPSIILSGLDKNGPRAGLGQQLLLGTVSRRFGQAYGTDRLLSLNTAHDDEPAESDSISAEEEEDSYDEPKESGRENSEINHRNRLSLSSFKNVRFTTWTVGTERENLHNLLRYVQNFPRLHTLEVIFEPHQNNDINNNNHNNSNHNLDGYDFRLPSRSFVTIPISSSLAVDLKKLRVIKFVYNNNDHMEHFEFCHWFSMHFLRRIVNPETIHVLTWEPHRHPSPFKAKPSWRLYDSNYNYLFWQTIKRCCKLKKLKLPPWLSGSDYSMSDPGWLSDELVHLDFLTSSGLDPFKLFLSTPSASLHIKNVRTLRLPKRSEEEKQLLGQAEGETTAISLPNLTALEMNVGDWPWFRPACTHRNLTKLALNIAAECLTELAHLLSLLSVGIGPDALPGLEVFKLEVTKYELHTEAYRREANVVRRIPVDILNHLSMITTTNNNNDSSGSTSLRRLRVLSVQIQSVGPNHDFSRGQGQTRPIFIVDFNLDTSTSFGGGQQQQLKNVRFCGHLENMTLPILSPFPSIAAAPTADESESSGGVVMLKKSLLEMKNEELQAIFPSAFVQKEYKM